MVRKSKDGCRIGQTVRRGAKVVPLLFLLEEKIMMDYELFLEVVKEKFMNYMSEWYQNGEMEIRAGNKDYNK